MSWPEFNNLIVTIEQLDGNVYPINYDKINLIADIFRKSEIFVVEFITIFHLVFSENTNNLN